jgi:hypothetical protein
MGFNLIAPSIFFIDASFDFDVDFGFGSDQGKLIPRFIHIRIDSRRINIRDCSSPRYCTNSTKLPQPLVDDGLFR